MTFVNRIKFLNKPLWVGKYIITLWRGNVLLCRPNRLYSILALYQDKVNFIRRSKAKYREARKHLFRHRID